MGQMQQQKRNKRKPPRKESSGGGWSENNVVRLTLSVMFSKVELMYGICSVVTEKGLVKF